jgi:hypothetical protein
VFDEHTQSRYEIVDHGKDKGLPTKLSEHGADDTNDRGDGEDGKAEPVDLLVPVGPRYRRKGLLGLKSVSDIIVRNVDVGGGIVHDLCPGGGCRGGRGRLARVDRRHDGKEVKSWDE